LKTITKTITGKLLDGIHNPDGLQSVLQEYSHNKGPLYIALSEATSVMTQRLTITEQQYKEQETKLQELQQLLQETGQKLQSLDKQVTFQGSKLASLQIKVQESTTLLDKVKILTGLGFGLDELTKLQIILVDIKASEGNTPEKAVKHFFNKVNTYQKVAALDSQKQAAETAAKKSKANAEKWQAQAKAAEAKAKARQTSINLTEKLITQGIKENDLPQWEGILAKAGVPPEKLAEALTKFSSFEKLCQDRQEYAWKLETQIGNLTAQVKALSEERQQVTAAIADLKEKALDEIEDISKQTLDIVGLQSQNAKNSMESIRQETVMELESVSKVVLQNMQALLEKSAEYSILERQAASLAEEIAMVRGFTSQDEKYWKQVSREVIRKLLGGMIVWCRVDSTNNARLSPPTNSLSSKLMYYEWSAASLAEVLEWAMTVTYTEAERKMLTGHL
jgi:hypothetical protein